jgi:hypothetical protein
VVGVQWQPFDNAQKEQETDLLDNVYVEALRQLAPDMGAYVNEVSDPLQREKSETLMLYEGIHLRAKLSRNLLGY